MNKEQTPVRVQEKTVRTIALEVIITSAAALIFKQPVVMILLGADFFIRAFIDSRYSLLAITAKSQVTGFLPFRKRMILLRPKKFAAAIGGIIALAAGIFGLSGQIIPMYYITSVLLIFSILETFFKFCAGCLMFGFLIQLKFIKEENCTDCRFDTEQ